MYHGRGAETATGKAPYTETAKPNEDRGNPLMLNRSGKITRKTIEMRTAGSMGIGYGPLTSAKDEESDAETQTAGAYDAGEYNNTTCGQRGAEMDDAAKVVYADVVLKGLRDAGIDVSGLEQGIIAPLGTHFAAASAATGREIDRETADLLDAFGTYEPRESAGSGTDAGTSTPDWPKFTRFQFDLPGFEAPSFTMPVSSKPDIKLASTVETVSGIRYSDALENTGSMTALDPDMLAAHSMYSKNISESARRAFMAASSKGGSDGSAHGMTPLGTVRGETADCGENGTPIENGVKSEAERKEMRYAKHRRADAPKHAAPSGQRGTASELVECGYRKPAGDTASFMAVAESAGIGSGQRFRTQSPDDTSTFIALAEKSREMIENGIDDGATPFETARHVARLTVAEAPIAIALVAAMTLGIGGMTAVGRLSDAGGVASGVRTGVDGIIGQISDLTTQAGAETTDGMQQYPHETIDMASVLTAPQTQVMSWTGYCADGWWFAGRTWSTDILAGSGQERVHDAWNAAGSVFTDHVATLDGRYLVAVKPALGEAGQYIDITLENGTVIPAIVADTKGNENYGAVDCKYVHSDGSIIELEVDADYGIEKSTGDVKSSGNVQSWIPEWASLVKSVTKYERYV